MQARRRLGEILSGILAERRRARSGDLGGGGDDDDLLNTLMRYRDDTGAALSDDQVADNVIGVLFAAQDTTASVLTWILKFLHDNPKLLEAVKVRSIERADRPAGRPCLHSNLFVASTMIESDR
jgi:(+)-abscisic acid 8'-hydroxylase